MKHYSFFFQNEALLNWMKLKTSINQVRNCINASLTFLWEILCENHFAKVENLSQTIDDLDFTFAYNSKFFF